MPWAQPLLLLVMALTASDRAGGVRMPRSIAFVDTGRQQVLLPATPPPPAPRRAVALRRRDATRLCDPRSPEGCGLHIGVNTSAHFIPRLSRLHRERRLRGLCSLRPGNAYADCTGTDVHSLQAGNVVRVGSVWPLLVIGPASGAGRLPFADAYGSTAPALDSAPLAALNLQLTPGLWDFVHGAAAASSTPGVLPYDSVPSALLAGLSSSLLSSSLLSGSVALGVLRQQDSAVTSSRAPLEVASLGSADGGAKLDGAWTLRLSGPFLAPSASRQRVFRYLPLTEPPRDALAVGGSTSGPDDADAVISRIRDEASDLYGRGGGGDGAANPFDAADAATLTALTADATSALGLVATVTHASVAMDITSSSSDVPRLRGLFGRGDVLLLGRSSVVVVGEMPPEGGSRVTLAAPWPWSDAAAVPIVRLDGAYALPGRATLTCGGDGGAAGARLSTTAPWLGLVSPGDVILLRVAPLRAVVVATAADAVSEAGVAVTIPGAASAACVAVGPTSAVSLPLRALACTAALVGGATDAVVQPGAAGSGPLRDCAVATRMAEGMRLVVGLLDGGGCDPGAGACPAGFPPLRLPVTGVSPAVGGGTRVALSSPVALPGGAASLASLPAYTSFVRLLACPVSLTVGLPVLRVAGGDGAGGTGCDLTKFVRQGTVVVAGPYRAMVVAGPALRPFESLLGTAAPAAGGAAAAVALDVLPAACSLTAAFQGPVPEGASEASGLALRVLPFLQLPARTSLAPPPGGAASAAGAASPSSWPLFTADDVRAHVGSSARLALAGWLSPFAWPIVQVAHVGGEGSGASRLAVQGEAGARATLLGGPSVDPLRTAPGGLLSQCPSLPALSPYALSAHAEGPGAPPASDGAAAALATAAAACTAQLPPGAEQRWWGAPYLDLRPSPLDAATGAQPDGGGSEQTVAVPCSGSVTVVQGSATVSTAADLHAMLGAGDRLYIGAPIEGVAVPGGFAGHVVVAHPDALVGALYTIAAPPTRRSLRLTAPYIGPTSSGVGCSLVRRRVRLPGRVFPTAGYPTLRSTADLRSLIVLGEPLEVVCSPAGPPVLFVAVPPISESLVAVSEPWPLAPPLPANVGESGCDAFRLIGGASVGVPLPGTVEVARASQVVSSTEDLSGSVRAGDRIRVGTQDVIARDPVTPHGFAIAAPYPGTSAASLRAFNLGRTGAQDTLEELARLKLACRSIYCLARIEDLERATPSTLHRSLNLAELRKGAGGGGGAPPQSAAEVRRRLLADNAAAEAAVEREWQAWYSKAKAVLDKAGGGEPQPEHAGGAQHAQGYASGSVRAAQAAAAASAGAAA